ncbi:hypothetical protein [Mucilaginibacter sp. SP1R1]|uniref:hypothetical protein n=1 Tax=Mucilaginibacter sp. SP1R1 TaxID=2723091 RepID=UPI00161AD35E|nr:hypothetical protein [Mucilaginibacter sp. SP1R1]MBB6150768.1 hypothetical protein [Mucilaginibacter sp. SP1R1]
MAVKGHHLKIQSTQGDECGFKIDTTAQLDFNLNDTAKFNIWTRIKYEVLCTGGVLSGISVYDSLNVAATTSNYTITSKSGENLVLKLLTPGNKVSQLSLNGSMNVFANLQPKKGTATSGTYNFTFTSLVIDPAKNGDIISGSATFATKGSSAEGVWDYKGTILFLPNHQAKITINGTAFTYDLQTGLAV